TISYADSFSDGFNRNTFAYPTAVTNADGFASSVAYNYDFGAATLTTDPKGAQMVMAYDSFGRLARKTYHDGGPNNVDGTYTRYSYPPSMNIIQIYTLINAGGSEAYSAQVMDGAGRVIASASDFPGSVGG